MKTRPSGFYAFTIVWIGQVISLLGTGMTRFALTLWAWQITGKATTLSLVSFFSMVPSILVSPLAGALVDRWNRKVAMMLSDLAAAINTILILMLYASGHLQIWHLYLTGALTSFFQAFQFPAYSAAITMMVSSRHYSRASGMLSMAEFISMILAPIASALLLNIIGLQGILIIDLITFVVAIGTLSMVNIPHSSVSEDGQSSKGSLWSEMLFGFRYINKRPSLLGLLLLFFCLNLVISFSYTVLSPMILTRTGNDTKVLGIVQSALGVGGITGSIVLSLWGGPKRRIHGVLIGITGSMMSMMIFGLGRETLTWALTAFFAMMFIPIMQGSSQAIWQSKVAPDVQGRVFATRSLIAQISAPVSMLFSGPLADYIFEPAMMSGGGLVFLFGEIIGSGPGTGMSLMFFLAGFLGVLIGLGGYTIPVVRNVENVLPDYKTDKTG